MQIAHYYRRPALGTTKTQALLETLSALAPGLTGMETEFCYNVGLTSALTELEGDALRWLLSETFEQQQFSRQSFLAGPGTVIELGPRLNFQTAWSSNAVSVARAVGLAKITRLERSRRYLLAGTLSAEELAAITSRLHDRMTECPYPAPLSTFATGARPEPAFSIPLIEEGRDALVRFNRTMGLGLDDWDIDYYYDLFVRDMGRNPTNVECFDLGQSNSEHSRHWFFRGLLVIDGKPMPDDLFALISRPYKRHPGRSVVAFSDNSSSIAGFDVRTIIPTRPGEPSAFAEATRKLDLTFTAETHNFPSGVAPFPGAETGTGGRIRDVQAVGRGGLVVAGTAAYCVGNLHVPGYELPWEDKSFVYPSNLATPLQIEIDASNGASDYGNKFGEPLIQGYTRSFGLRMPSGERREWVKPIMFTGGVGQMDASHARKNDPAKGMLVTKVGGPAYRIGMGGGAASSMVQGENLAELDFNAVQRGDAEMEQKLNRVIRACVEMGELNPIVSIHDQGAGGNCNVLKELVAPAGARIDVRAIPIGDETLSVLEIWGAEYQENNALLIRPEHKGLFESLCEREKVPCAFLGTVTGDGRVVLYDSLAPQATPPVDLDLKKVLAEMPRKTFDIKRSGAKLAPLALPADLTVKKALDRVLRLVSVGSKRFLTNKVDRSVTGLIARQQCAGPLLLTVSDYAVVAQSHLGLTGTAITIGEQPIKGLIDAAAMARMSVAEALTNMAFVAITSIEDIRCSGNWMWAAKLPGEGALVYDAAVAMSDIMTELGIAIDGGKDSLSMAAMEKSTGELIKAPGALVISAYAPVEDITRAITPDIARPGKSVLMHIDLAAGKRRLGGSALAQVFEQVGDTTPDIEDAALLVRAFNEVQALVAEGIALSGHDCSDGGLIVTLLEMAFAGNCGLKVELSGPEGALEALFAEEAGLVFECDEDAAASVIERLAKAHVPCVQIAQTLKSPVIDLYHNGALVLEEPMVDLRALWEETSYRLECLQVDPSCAYEENQNIYEREAPAFELTFTPQPPATRIATPPRVAVIREEGSNGDREMTSAFYMAGFEPWDVTVTDLMSGRASLAQFRGIVFVGGFSYADVLDSAKGWAGTIRFNERLKAEFAAFYGRTDTFSLGVCNGCQLMALLGLVPWQGIADDIQPRFIHNRSGRFESRFSTVRILESPSLMLAGMEGSVLGVWVAHGEGQAHFPDPDIRRKVLNDSLAPLRYVDDMGDTTDQYPFNPNGSVHGIAALCSPDGRHLAMMPHPERAFLKWQWPWMPERWRYQLAASPWLRMFQNAYDWCKQ